MTSFYWGRWAKLFRKCRHKMMMIIANTKDFCIFKLFVSNFIQYGYSSKLHCLILSYHFLYFFSNATFFPPAALVQSLEEAIARSKQGRPVSPEEQHRMVRKIYTWANVAKRTEVVSLVTNVLVYKWDRLFSHTSSPKALFQRCVIKYSVNLEIFVVKIIS